VQHFIKKGQLKEIIRKDLNPESHINKGKEAICKKMKNTPILTHNQVVLGSRPLGPPKSSSCK